MIHTLKDRLSLSELRIFRAIYENGPISRVRLATGLDLTRAAITINIKRLHSLGLIEEMGKSTDQTGRGRREILLSIKQDAGLIIGIHIALRYVSYGIVDLNGNIIAKKTNHYPIETPPHQVLDPLIPDINKLVNDNNIDPEKIIGIGVGMPGIISQVRGVALESTLDGWEGFALRDFLEEKLGYPVHLENDVKTLTLGEFHYGSGKDVKDFVCLWIEDGIGSGIINEGRLMRGTTSSAGEIGFNEFIVDLPIKRSILIEGQPRCWGDILSYANIQNSIRRGLEKGWQSNLNEEATIDDFVSAIQNEDALAIHLFRLLSRIIGTLGCNLLYTFNPHVLLMSGHLFNKLPDLLKEVYSHINKGVLRSPIEAAKLRNSALGEDAVTIGGAALVLEDFFKASEPKVINAA